MGLEQEMNSHDGFGRIDRRSFLRTLGSAAAAAAIGAGASSCGKRPLEDEIEEYMDEMRKGVPAPDFTYEDINLPYLHIYHTDARHYLSLFKRHLGQNLGDYNMIASGRVFKNRGELEKAAVTVKKAIAAFNLLHEISKEGSKYAELYHDVLKDMLGSGPVVPGLWLDPLIQTVELPENGEGAELRIGHCLVAFYPKGKRSPEPVGEINSVVDAKVAIYDPMVGILKNKYDVRDLNTFGEGNNVFFRDLCK